MIDFWLRFHRLEPLGRSTFPIPLIRERKTLLNAGRRDFLGFYLQPDDRRPPLRIEDLPASADLLVLYDVPTGGRLQEEVLASEPRSRSQRLYPCPVARIEADFDSYLRGRFGRRKIAKLDRRLRRLEALGELKMDWVARKDLDGSFRKFFLLLKESVLARAEYNPHLLAREYLHALWRELLGRELSVSALTLDGVPISFRTGFIHGQRFFGYIPVIDRAFRRLSIGNLHVYLLLQELLREGVREYDFSKGAAIHKSEWANHCESLSVVVVPLGRGLRCRARLHALWRYEQAREMLRRTGLNRHLRRWQHAILRRTSSRWIRLTSSFDARPPVVFKRMRCDDFEPQDLSYRDVDGYPLAARRKIVEELDRLTRTEGRAWTGRRGGERCLSASEHGEGLTWECDERPS
jgi:hypothetical protein